MENFFLCLQSWIEKSVFIDDISPIYRISDDLERILSIDYRMGGILEKYRESRNIGLEPIKRRKPIKILEEAYQNIGDISAIYRIYRRYIGYIDEYMGYIDKYIGYIADISGNIGDFF